VGEMLVSEMIVAKLEEAGESKDGMRGESEEGAKVTAQPQDEDWVMLEPVHKGEMEGIEMPIRLT